MAVEAGLGRGPVGEGGLKPAMGSDTCSGVADIETFEGVEDEPEARIVRRMGFYPGEIV